MQKEASFEQEKTSFQLQRLVETRTNKFWHEKISSNYKLTDVKKLIAINAVNISAIQ